MTTPSAALSDARKFSPWRVMQQFIKAIAPQIEAQAARNEETLTIHYAAEEHRDIVATGFDPLKVKPRRKGLGPKQLKWLRANVLAFKDMESRAKASKSGTAAPGKK